MDAILRFRLQPIDSLGELTVRQHYPVMDPMTNPSEGLFVLFLIDRILYCTLLLSSDIDLCVCVFCGIYVCVCSVQTKATF